MIAPTTNRVTQGKHGRYNAVDYSASPDSTIYAPEGGKITAYGASGTCGNRLELTAGSNRHGFCHLERSLVSVGQNVVKGQPIGVMGYTGYTIPEGPAGRHLHWVINRGGVYVYPPSLVNEQGGSDDVFKSREEVGEAYLMLRGKRGTASEENAWIGLPKQRFFQVAKPEADGYRSQYSSLERNFVIVRNERDQARKEKAVLVIQRDNLNKELAIMTADRDKLKVELESAIEAHKKVVDDLNKVIKIKDDEIVRLNKELDNAGTDCDKLSGWGLIIRGIKKLFERSK